MKMYILILVLFISCNNINQNTKQMDLTNFEIRDHEFLKEMYRDQYFSNFLVDKAKQILINLCYQIETERPQNLTELYKLTHKATDQFNDLQDEFYENNSEIETAARDCIGTSFEFISKAYGFNADTEELIATREW